jgi:hypothetical protein
MAERRAGSGGTCKAVFRSQDDAPLAAAPDSASIAFLAVGTRGDVQPLAILAARLASTSSSDVHFLTNSTHSFLAAPLAAAGVRVKYLSLAPASAAKSASSDQPVVNDDHERGISDEQHREVRAVVASFSG